MQKNQSFSTLFRHYSKYHGLCKDELSFYFVEELHAEDTPESAHMMSTDEITVGIKQDGHKYPYTHLLTQHTQYQQMNTKQNECSHTTHMQPMSGNTGGKHMYPHNPVFSPLTHHLRVLLHSHEHYDVKLIVGGIDTTATINSTVSSSSSSSDRTTSFDVLYAHQAILSARSTYFHTILSLNTTTTINGISTNSSGSGKPYLTLEFPEHDSSTMQLVLEYLYTDYIENIQSEFIMYIPTHIYLSNWANIHIHTGVGWNCLIQLITYADEFLLTGENTIYIHTYIYIHVKTCVCV